MRSIRRDLSIPEHTQHYSMVGYPFIHQAVALSRHRHRITVTPRAPLRAVWYLSARSEHTHTRESTRLCAAEMLMSEQP